jgi:predicted ArsR family transcriptional regulator
MQAFERVLDMWKTGNKTLAIAEYADMMGISREQAKKALENLQQYSKRVQPSVIRRQPNG